MSPPEAERGLDRRSLIKRGAIAGVTAWTAPLILESVTRPAAAQSTEGPPDPQPAVATGIRFFNATYARRVGPPGNIVSFPATLVYGGTPQATTALTDPAVDGGQDRTYTAFVQLIDQYGNAYSNDTGVPISVTIARTGGTGGPTPASLTIPTGASVSSGSSTITLEQGGAHASMTAGTVLPVVGAVTATVSTNSV